MSNSGADTVTAQILIGDLVENILRYSDNPGACADYITSQIRELIGVRSVALIDMVTDAAGTNYGTVSVCPQRKRAEWDTPEVRALVRELARCEAPCLVDPEADLSRRFAFPAGFGKTFVIPLAVGAEPVGMIILQDLLEEGSASIILESLTRIAGVISLILRNSILYRNMERTVRERTTQLATREKEFRALFEHSTVGKSLTALDGKLLRINKAFADMLGYTIEEIDKRNFAQITHPADMAKSRECIEALLADERAIYRMEKRYIHKTGDIVWADVSATLLRDEQGTPLYFVTSIVDTTERKRAEEKLRESEAKYMDLYDHAPDMYLSVDAKTAIIGQCNRTLADNLGYSKDELIGRPVFDLYHGDCREEAGKAFLCFTKMGEVRDKELQLKRKDGTKFDVSLNVSAVIDQDGNILYSSSTLRDITDRKRAEAERERLQAQLLQAQKMESVGRLAGGVAHDFNNMLGVIIGHVELAMERVDPAQSLFDDLRAIRKAAERSADLTQQLLAFARKQIITPKVLDLNETVEGMPKMLRRLIGEDIDLAWLPGGGPPLVKMDPSQVDQVLANLCVNARDAIGGVGKVTIETKTVVFDAECSAANLGLSAGEYVLLAVSDTGCGMDGGTLSRLFEPFFTTKETGKGTGLGLAMIYGIVRQNNGFINVYSEPGQGTTFKIYLPRYRGKAEQQRQEGPEAPAARGKETILVAEDETEMLNLITMVLQRQGYTVLAASTPGEAIRLAEEHRGEIHLLVTDVVMPEMNGRELAKHLISLYPKLKRLFMSGYTANVIAHHGVLEAGVRFMQKPFSTKEIAARVREALDD